MNNQVILSALQSQLTAKEAELELQKTSIVEPALKAITEEVLQSLRVDVSPLIPNISIDHSRLEIMRNNGERWSSMTVYLERNWRSDDKATHVKINWYGSSATLEDQNTLNDVQIFGAVASKLQWIQHEFINNWSPKIAQVANTTSDLETSIYELRRNVTSVENQIREEGINSYKKEGFSCELTPTLNIARDWDTEGHPYVLVSSVPNIKLSTGRSRWDYVCAKSFKVLKTNKYKTTLEITQSDDRVVERTVSAKSFDEFIYEVYEWQTKRSKEHNDKITERFENQYAKQSA